MFRTLRLPVLIPSLLFCLSAHSAMAQSAPPADPLAAARKALEAGELDAAATLAGEALEREPASRPAAEIRIRALARGGDLDGAAGAYEGWMNAARKEDPALLEPIAEAHLHALSGNQTQAIAVPALQRLAERGDKPSRAALEKLARPSADDGSSPHAAEALARLGDPAALKEIEQRLESRAPGARAAALRLLADVAPERAKALVRRMVEDQDPFVRLTAIETAGEVGATAVRDRLRALLGTPDLLTRLTAAVALKRLGAAEGDALLAESLQSDLPDARLLAAMAFVQSRGPWMESVRPLLADPNGLNSLRAAALLAPYEPSGITRVLFTALEDANPTIRDEAARILTGMPGTDPAAFRLMLADASPWVRLRGALGLAPATRTQARR
jgi:HEAT repeat protein